MPRLFVLLCATAGIGLAACGSDSSDEELSVSEYRDKANALCRQSEREADAAASDREPGVVLDKLTATARDSQARFEALDPPAELQKRHDAFLRSGERSVNVLSDARDQVEKGARGEAAFEKLQGRFQAVLEEGNDAARALGLKDCVAE